MTAGLALGLLGLTAAGWVVVLAAAGWPPGGSPGATMTETGPDARRGGGGSRRVPEAAWPITVALLHLWAFPYSHLALRTLAYRCARAEVRGVPSILG